MAYIPYTVFRMDYRTVDYRNVGISDCWIIATAPMYIYV